MIAPLFSTGRYCQYDCVNCRQASKTDRSRTCPLLVAADCFVVGKIIGQWIVSIWLKRIGEVHIHQLIYARLRYLACKTRREITMRIDDCASPAVSRVSPEQRVGIMEFFQRMWPNAWGQCMDISFETRCVRSLISRTIPFQTSFNSPLTSPSVCGSGKLRRSASFGALNTPSHQLVSGRSHCADPKQGRGVSCQSSAVSILRRHGPGLYGFDKRCMKV